MQNNALQELMLAIMPQWHYWMAKPFKQMLDENVSVGMYCCIHTLAASGDTMTMSELARSVHCSKQQTTKTVSKLIACGLAERIPDPADRRIIRLRLTKEGLRFTDSFLEGVSAYYKPMLDRMQENDLAVFNTALEMLHEVFTKLETPDNN